MFILILTVMDECTHFKVGKTRELINSTGSRAHKQHGERPNLRRMLQRLPYARKHGKGLSLLEELQLIFER